MINTSSDHSPLRDSTQPAKVTAGVSTAEHCPRMFMVSDISLLPFLRALLLAHLERMDLVYIS